MTEFATTVLFQPPTAALRFLPEGPYPCGLNQFSWVAIQHGGDAVTGSLNVFDLSTGINVSHPLPGRPGFAFMTNQPNTFVIGLEREVVLFDTQSRQARTLCGPVETDVENTIINDGVLFDGGLIFGCKDLQFQTKKAGLYLWRRRDRKLIRLRHDQICSNGKEVCQLNGQLSLLDIDSPTKTVVAYPLDVANGWLGEPRIVVDCRAGDSFPDGMILTPDRQSCIVAFYNPHDVAHGEARQYRLQTGELEAVWKTIGSPRVTCPQLVRHETAVKLILTTAVEHMTPEQQARHPQAGALFIGDTTFAGFPNQPVFEI